MDEARKIRTLLVSVDAANVAFEMLAALEALIAPGHLAFVATNVLCRQSERWDLAKR